MAVVIPPRSTAVPSVAAGTIPSQRDGHIQMIGDKGRRAWQKATGYGQRSHAETTMFRYKVTIGSSLRARTLPAQKTKAKVSEVVPGFRLSRRWGGRPPAASMCQSAGRENRQKGSHPR